MELNPKGLALRYWYVAVLLVIVLASFWLRAMPARFNELQALDPFLFYRMSEDVLNSGHMPDLDMLRYYPAEISPNQYVTPLPVYMPVLMYSGLSAVGMNMPYLNFAIMFPAIMGTLAVFVMYFIGKELFNSRVAGLFAAFFLAVTPAFLTRTSAGFFEKEPIAGFFMMLSILFFIKTLKRNNLRRDIAYMGLSFTSFLLLVLTWGGAQYVYLLTGGFIGIIFGINIILVVLEYLFPSNFNSAIKKLGVFVGPRMIKAYLPVVLVSLVSVFLKDIPGLSINETLVYVSFAVFGILIARYGVKRYGILKQEQIRYFIPSVVVAGFLVLLIGSMFSGFFSGIIYQLGSFANPVKPAGELGTTIAENMPGTLGEVTGKLGNSMASQVLPQLGFLAPYLTLWVFMMLGSVLLVYEFFKTKRYIYILPLFWVISSIWSVFAKIRLTFLVGPAAAVAGAFLFMWLIKKARKYRNSVMITERLGLVSVLAVAVLVFTVVINFANGYAYSAALGPSICFPMKDEQGNVIPCLEINEDSTYKMNENQPWYQAMSFLSGTGQDNSVLSWWDFGYWFQARGDKPCVADGGNLGGYAKRNKEIAQWFTSPASSWSEHTEWLQKYKVGYILMDYTLISKFGAITSIASDGQEILGFMEFEESNSYQKGNQTVHEFKAGSYAIWIPVNENGGVEGSLRFMQSQDGRYVQIGYINQVCTENGIMNVGVEDSAIPGCVAMSPLGIYYVPPEAKDSIFVNLMFMDGHGLPLENVFDNTFVKIYKVLY